MSNSTIELAKKIRLLSLEMVHRAKASHIASALSITDILAVLYGKVMNFTPSNPEHEDRDRFILSKGHACVANYAVLAAIGTLKASDLLLYGQDYSSLMNHISHKVRGVEFSTGSLGHGLPFGVGKALASKKMRKTWKTYVLVGDGEMQEGSNWEALMFASHYKLDNISLIIDCNNLQSLTTVDNTLSIEPIIEKIKSFGWDVLKTDGHDHQSLYKNLSKLSLKPKCIICKTIKGKGVSFMENKVDWHYKSPNDSELELALKELKIN